MTQFIVQNTSPQRKSVTVFGLSIPYGATANLMQLPNVTENIIADSLLKGELRLRIDNRDLTVTLCTVLIPSADSTFTNYLVSIGLGSSVHPEESKSYLKQDEWYIDPVNGNDNRSGKTEAASIKTWAEWRRRVGENSMLTPTNGLLQINILNDMPESDPILFTNSMDQNCSAFISGTKKMLATGIVTGVMNKDRALNIPWQITDANKSDDFWQNHIGHSVEIVSGAGTGSRAFVARDMNDFGSPKTAHMSEWMAGSGAFLDIAPGNAPEENDTYEIYDYSTVSIGAFQSNGIKTIKSEGGNGFQSIQLSNVRVDGVPGDVNGGFFDCAIGPIQEDGGLIVTDSIFHTNLQVNSGSRNLYFANCSTQGKINVQRGWFWYIGGCHQPQFDVPESGGLDCHYQGENIFIGADPTFVGKNGGDIDASLNGLGTYYAGPFSVWDSYHTIVQQPNTIFNSGAGNFFFGDPWTGEVGGVPFWGTGNSTPIFTNANSTLNVSQLLFGSLDTTWILPVVDGYDGETNFVGFSPTIMDNPDQTKYYGWNPSVGTYVSPPVGAPFDSFDIGGTFETSVIDYDDSARVTVSNAFQPVLGSRITFGLLIIVP